ncbi:MAG: methylated-DNA--[protein]-cysteine S-methyltransferase [Promethearchaeota archaeon]
MKFLTFPSPFGPFTIVWWGNEPDLQLKRIFLSDPEQKSENKALKSFQGLNLGSASSITSLGNKIQEFLEGEDVEFNLDLPDFSLCTSIQEKVLRADFRIPRGWVSTYKRIANYIRVQNGARVVGNLLARNPFPIIIPCHRAIKSNGELGGYQGGIDMKRKLLEMEGIEFSNSGKVLTKKIFY